MYYPSWWEEGRNTPNNMLQYCTIRPGGKRTGTHRSICYNSVLSVLVGRRPEHTDQYATIVYYPSWWEEGRNTPNNMLQYCTIRPGGKRTGTHRSICYNSVLSVLVGRRPEHTEQYATILYYLSWWEEGRNTPNNMLQYCTIRPRGKRTGTHRTICYNTVLSVLVGRGPEHTEQYATILYYLPSWEEDRNTPNNMLQYCIIRPGGKKAGTHRTICYNTVLSVLVGRGPEHTEQYATIVYYLSWWEEGWNTPNNMLQYCIICPGGKRTGTHRTICYNTVLSVLVGRGPEHTEQYATILYYPSSWEEDRNTPNNMLQYCTICPGGKRVGTHRTICYNTVLSVLVGRGPEHTEQYATILYYPSWWEEGRNTPNNMLQYCIIRPGGKRAGTHRTICYNTVLSVLVGRVPEHTEQYATIVYYPSWWEEGRNTPNNMLQ